MDEEGVAGCRLSLEYESLGRSTGRCQRARAKVEGQEGPLVAGALAATMELQVQDGGWS